jgi:hypothetical protein
MGRKICNGFIRKIRENVDAIKKFKELDRNAGRMRGHNK